MLHQSIVKNRKCKDIFSYEKRPPSAEKNIYRADPNADLRKMNERRKLTCHVGSYTGSNVRVYVLHCFFRKCVFPRDSFF